MRRAPLMLLGLGALLACGSEPPEPAPAPSQTPPPTARAHPPAAKNRPPVIGEVEISPQTPRPGEQLVARAEATDPDGDDVELSYHWKLDGKALDATGPFLEVEKASRGSAITVEVTASDGVQQAGPRRATVHVANSPPHVDGVELDPSGELHANQDLVAKPAGTDPDGDKITYSYRWSVNGSVVPESGAKLPASRFSRRDSIELDVVASDGTDASEPYHVGPIEVGNTPPRITSTPGPIAKDGVFRYDVVAEDPDGDLGFSYRLLSGPEGMTIGAHDGHLVWKPGPKAEGNHPVEVEVSDPYGGKATQLFQLRLSYAPAAPAKTGGGTEDTGD